MLTRTVGQADLAHHCPEANLQSAAIWKRQDGLPPVVGGEAVTDGATASLLDSPSLLDPSLAGLGSATDLASATTTAATIATAPTQAAGPDAASNLAWQQSYSSMAAQLAATPSLINDPTYQSAFASAFGQDGAAMLSQYSTALASGATLDSSAISGIVSSIAENTGALSSAVASVTSSAEAAVKSATDSLSDDDDDDDDLLPGVRPSGASTNSTSTDDDDDDTTGAGSRVNTQFGLIAATALLAGCAAMLI